MANLATEGLIQAVPGAAQQQRQAFALGRVDGQIVVEFFSGHSDPNLFKERHALSQSEFRKLVQPLIRTGHIVQDFRGGFRSVFVPEGVDRAELRKEYIRKLVQKFPVITLRQMTQLAGPSFKPEELKAVLNTFEEDGTLIKGFLIEDFHRVCWGRKEML